MNPLDWVPEPYPKSGGLAAEGFYKLLGRPRLDPLTVLVRETAQNSWDARREGETVRFSIDGWTPIWDEELECLREIVFPDAAKSQAAVDGVLRERGMDALIISDRGTHGLGGPTLADEVSPDETYDWVDFVLNVGKPNLKGQTGGTYGFGKTITYIVSSGNAVVIHSRTMHRGKPQARLIGCAIGTEFKHGGRLHTGRHWWGRSSAGAPEPETGRHADQIAESIGMPSFNEGELGTNIMVIGPDFGGRSAEQAMNFIAESVTWHLWPKLMKHGRRRRPPMEVQITWNGESVAVPKPEERPPLHGFAQAFRALLDGVEPGRQPDGLERRLIQTFRPKVDIGDVVTVPLVARDRAIVDDGHDPADDESPAAAAAITEVCHHVALLRSPELVVSYLPGPAPSDGGSEWAAVFRSTKEADEHFAASEPPTHDSWEPQLLEKSAGKTVVKVGLQRLQQFLDDRWGTRVELQAAHGPGSTAVVADALGYIVRAQPGLGAGGGERGGSGGRSGRRRDIAKAEVELATASIVDGKPATTAMVFVTPRTGSAGTRLEVTVGVAVDENSSDPDLDPDLALVRAVYQDKDVALKGTSAAIEIAGSERVEGVVLFAARSVDTAISLDLRVEALDELDTVDR